MDKARENPDQRRTEPAIQTHTRSGHLLCIKAACLDDLPLLVDLYAHLSLRDLQFRLGQVAAPLDAEELAALLDEGSGTSSYLALSDGIPVACATLVRDASRVGAQVILAVRPDWKGRGVSWTLLEHVLARAAAMGLKRIFSAELGDDREAINLQREMGFVARLKSADPVAFSMVKALDA